MDVEYFTAPINVPLLSETKYERDCVNALIGKFVKCLLI